MNPTPASATSPRQPDAERIGTGDFDALREYLEIELRAAAAGVSEYDLLRRVRAAGFLTAVGLDDSLSLFRIHFSLFHALYTLRDQLLACGEERLSISPLSIELARAATPENKNELDVHDALRDYYLDLEHLRDTGRAQVDAMLNRFWQRMDRCDARDRALAALGLRDPVDNLTIKRRYRSLVMRHHPDRGGDSADFHAINEALRALI